MNMSENLMIVRQMQDQDLSAYMQLMDQFHKASPMKKVCELDWEGLSQFLLGAKNNPDMSVFLAELNGQIVGVTGGIIYPLYFCSSHKVAQELWWWLTPSARGSGAGNMMFKELQSWAKERGAKTMFMIALEDERAEKMEKVYCRAGFEPMERTFMKGIM